MSLVKEELEKFQKTMWSHDKPLLYAIEIVERILYENKRMRTIMMEALHEIDGKLDSHLTQTEQDQELFRLLDNLCLKRQDIYPQHLSGQNIEKFREEVRAKLDFSAFEKGEN